MAPACYFKCPIHAAFKCLVDCQTHLLDDWNSLWRGRGSAKLTKSNQDSIWMSVVVIIMLLSSCCYHHDPHHHQDHHNGHGHSSWCLWSGRGCSRSSQDCQLVSPTCTATACFVIIAIIIIIIIIQITITITRRPAFFWIDHNCMNLHWSGNMLYQMVYKLSTINWGLSWHSSSWDFVRKKMSSLKFYCSAKPMAGVRASTNIPPALPT